MLSKLFESFLDEISKEDNKQIIQNVFEPYITTFNIGLFVFIFIFLLLLVVTSYNTYCLYNIRIGRFVL